MDPGKSVDEKFSKLHTRLPVDTRIGIVGAGPSGLSAAYALAKLGYHNVTVFEKCQNVSGMCESIDIEGRTYDLGGQVIAANSAPVITHLAKELGSEFEEMDSHKLALIDSKTGNIRDLEVAEDYVSMVSLTLKLQDEANRSGRVGIHAVSGLASDPTLEFLKQHGLSSVPKSVAYGYTASGYGFVQDMPYAFIQEFTRTSMAGKIRRFKHGYMSLWEKLSQSLPFEVLCGTEILRVKRDSCGASVHIKNNNNDIEVREFDKIILSGSIAFKNGKTYRSLSLTDGENEVVELNDLERELFSKVQTIDYYTTVVKIEGFEHMPKGFYYFGEYMEDPTTIGHPVAMQRFFADTNVFLFWSYGNSADIKGSYVAKCVTNVVTSMGGTVQNVLLQRRFKYFPHVSSEDMKNGFYERVESQLQGFQNTYYVGGLLAFELTERNALYSISSVCKHFAIGSELPPIPYVKRLFPLSIRNPSPPRDIGELEGVEFPDLPSLDGYLQYWGTHKVTAKKVIYTWINEEGKIMNRRTYQELHDNASHIAYKLLTSTKPIIKPGDRVLLIHLPGLEFVDAFFGCIRAGVIPVPVLPPDPMQRGGQALLKVENVSKVCNAVAILSTSSYHAAVRAGYVKNIVTLAKSAQKCSAQWPDLPWIHTDSWIKNYRRSPDSYNLESAESMITKPQPSELCFLQFTSGSTGDAKGVMITHGGLIHNVKMMKKRYRSTSKTVLISWLPQYHDMGLIGGLFTSLVSGGTSILFSPMTFIRNPLLWLQTINDYHGTHSAGPNFAFELVIRRLEAEKNKTYDLSSMIFIMIAAEPVRQKTIKRFVELTQPFGFSEGVLAPGYGLAENCVFVSCAFGECKPIFIDWQGRVCCGYVDPDDTDIVIKIVDVDSLTEHQEDGAEGEIWISSPSSGVGYWNNKEISQKTFCNQLKNYPNKNFTRTGDLGRIIGGKLFITGRIKDLIIVAGRNIYSADVEKTVEGSSDVLRPGCCAVVGVPEEVLTQKGISVPDSSDQVGLVVIAEVREGKAVSEDIADNIKTRVAEEHGVTIASVKLIKPRTISKTTSGKIRRFECMKQFVDNTLSLANSNHISKRKSLFRSLTTGTGMEIRRPSLKQTVDPTVRPQTRSKVKNFMEIIEFLIQLVSDQTGIPKEKISPTDSLPSYGFDSIAVVRAAQKLSDFLGTPVGAIDIFTASCISELANFLENLVHKSQPQLAPQPIGKVKMSKEIIEFLKQIVSDQTGIPKDKISPTDSLPSYGFDSITVVRAAQKLSDFLGIPVGAIDIFTASCIDELATFLENLVHKSQPQLEPDVSCSAEDENLVIIDASSSDLSVFATGTLQLLALTYVCFILLLPAYIASSMYMGMLSSVSLVKLPLLSYLSSLVLAPIAWICYALFTSLSLSILGKSFLQPNYVLTPDVSIWSVDFVKWWALNKAQSLAANMLAVHLKGTIFLNYWFKMQGARIGSSVVIDTIDITDPSLLAVADGAVVAEGVLILGHEVRNEVLSFRHVKIGQKASIGPYAVLQKGTIVHNGVVVPPLQKTEQGKLTYLASKTSACMKEEARIADMAFEHLVSIYAVGFLGALSSATVFMLYSHFSGTTTSLQNFSFACIAGAFHWLPAVIAAYAVIVRETTMSPVSSALLLAFAYLSYGIILSLLTSITKKALATRSGAKNKDIASLIQRRITIAAHLRFAKMLSGTEAFCMYLRLLGANIGRHCSIRAINPVANPELISIGDGVHLGDFCNIVPGFYSKGFASAVIKVQDNTVVGSGSLLLPGSVLQENVILGALSVAPQGSVLQQGGVYVGAQSLTLVKNTLIEEDERIEEMDPVYKKIVGNLAANLAITTMNVKSRYFHRIGVSGRGVLRMYQDIPSLPKHKIFGAGKSFPVIVRHSNSLSADDDARLDARGAAVRILSDDGEVPLLDLTLKSGKAFYARTIADFATWLVCGLPAREEQVKQAPHIRDAVWGSLRNTHSYTVLHYYSNICRLLRFEDGKEMYAKFKLRPADKDVSEDSGQVVPRGILPPETGAIPRDADDTRPLLFLADDFRRKVEAPEGVRYVFQLQLRDVPADSAARDAALDCTQPWDEAEFPYIEVGEIRLASNVPTEETEKLEFNPFLRCPEVDVIPATSCTQSASIDHGRSLVYEICQRLRNGEPLPASWRAFLDQSDTKIDLSGCPVMAATRSSSNVRHAATKVTLARTWYQALWATLCQPLLQTLVPYFTMGLVIFLPLRGLLAVSTAVGTPLYWSLPVFWVTSGVAAMATCAAAKWALVGRRADGDAVHIWAPAVFLDTVWQAVRTAAGEYFAELTPGSVLFAAWMRAMGASVAAGDGVYVDSMGALLNPEMVRLERGASVGRDALLFGHVYEGEGGEVKFGAVHVGEDGFVGSRAVAMPGVRVDDGGCLGALGLAMKEEIVRNRM
ncbi:hypothetical protein PAHAL_6G288900 [Panicum hallii]|uniref:4-coumarate--CoA ligase n=1 Tax=Panicum hallii TaxID=206008 RepID=A0A2S3I4J8_9POAL|nr:uncharacterized protein LOC112898531 [Panicum hallii]PAN36509.1 hypothetical protein PAHAL_6G288900 [Panicum hallii]